MSENNHSNEKARQRIGDDNRSAFDDVEEFSPRHSPNVKALVRGIDAEPEVVLACDAQQDEDNPSVYIHVFHTGDFDAAAVMMEFLDYPDAMYVGDSNEVYSALRELAENDYCWTVTDTHGIAETYIEDNPAV